ncbi:MAG TPA: hypothetical protein PKG71_02610 [Candidatus Woesebacteria bacterium]|nr:hypothetical protein [Candidatus Woesebacteria bacterium]HNS94835.1 hypothetical protein [Candidatus Woesebacteria bacterium]
MSNKYIIYLSELLRAVSQKIRLNPLYAIPYIFLIGVMLFAILLGLAVVVLPK